ncbi:ParB/RepB/Spo0J family partition protein [Salmonella enterica]|nr:ParB/RepB/Spo0J family partition protein [Salmonella enterica]EIM0470288.1 ParB/RepB/Spo0J family partition protein [Salmonella enterica]
MPVTKCEPETTRKASRKSVKTQETALSALLAQTEEVSVPLDSLIKSPLNVRTVPYSAESVSELADSIKGVGLLQNLVVHALPGDRYGVAAGGRRLAALTDLFSDDEGGYVDCVALDAALLEKLQAVAEHLREAEGWEWCAGRMEPVGECREDSRAYRNLPEPEAVLTEAEEERLNELMMRYDALENQCEESDLLAAEMKLIDCMAKVRAWTPEMRAGSGVVVSWRYGNVCVQRGVQLRSEDDVTDDADRTEQVQEKASVEEISLPLLTKMSSERTLAVQAALMQQPDKSLALLTWTLCLNVFGSGAYSKPAQISLECKHYSLTSDAPSGKEGAAFMALMAEKARLVALLPEGWSRDMTTFLSLSQEVLLSLLSFCTACSIHGVQTRECGHTSRSPLDPLETAIGFHMRDWWQPTKANFFGHLKKPQIIAALNEAGLSGAARDAEKMKKGDAAEHAEFHMKDNRWVPGWMCAPRPQTDATERADNLADAA